VRYEVGLPEELFQTPMTMTAFKTSNPTHADWLPDKAQGLPDAQASDVLEQIYETIRFIIHRAQPIFIIHSADFTMHIYITNFTMYIIKYYINLYKSFRKLKLKLHVSFQKDYYMR
jgi:hypothetical protein